MFSYILKCLKSATGDRSWAVLTDSTQSDFGSKMEFDWVILSNDGEKIIIIAQKQDGKYYLVNGNKNMVIELWNHEELKKTLHGIVAETVG